MTIRDMLRAGLLAGLLGVVSAGSAPAWNLDFEAAMVLTTRNDVRIPGTTGTEFSLADDLSPDDDVAFRARLGHRLGDRSHLSVLYAPLTLHSRGTAGFPIAFNGETFAADADLASTYRFNSYRATWRYDLSRSDDLIFSLGATAKVRDAFIELSDGTTTTRKDNLGFVPLVHVRLDWRWGNTLGLLIEGDALAAPGAPGRAEDVLAALVLRPRADGSLRLGYRILEGGADVDEVYNFAFIHYYTFGWSQQF
ncbi:MAG: hypothetical protein R3D98_04865 [Candidatus Krumholzibacteriia bacterium]